MLSRLPRVQLLIASGALLLGAVMAAVLTPHTLMARTSESLNLGNLIPTEFGDWKPVPNVRVVEPPGSDTLSKEIYSQELARGYVDHDGHVIMLLIAYGASQSDRLQLHRPEICYTAQGFRVSRPVTNTFSYREDAAPIRMSMLIAKREARTEPILYWMRIGHDVASGVVERQILKVKYGLMGLIPDGALVRISMVGLPEQAALDVEEKFTRDLLASVNPAARNFLIGRPE